MTPASWVHADREPHPPFHQAPQMVGVLRLAGPPREAGCLQVSLEKPRRQDRG